MPRFPKGTVTFLAITLATSITDAQAQQIREAITSQRGVFFRDEPAMIAAAWNAALPALQAALQAQRLMLAGAADQPAGLQMALYTGRDHDQAETYFGPAMNHLLSLVDAGHPGQILISASTQEALGSQVAGDIHIHSLGEYRLRNLCNSVQIYQALAPELPAGFPPLQTLDLYAHNLPIQSSPLIGREQEVASLCELLRTSSTRLITVLGASGMGKTRLALQAGVEVISEFPDGVYFVALAPVSDPTLLVSMIAQVLGVKEQAGQPLLKTLVDFLEAKRILLVLDNFEQLLVAAPTVSEIGQATSHVKVLVTSQVALDLELEQIFAVPPLAMPDPTQQLSVDQLSQIPAVALFVERAREVQPAFTLTAALAPAVIELCARLEGLPLAIELVAAQSKRYFPGDMLIMLQNRLNVARPVRWGSTRDATLSPVLDWICEGLGAGVAGFFVRLGIFAGGCTSESASAICNPTNDLALDVSETLDLLLENHLLLREELKEGHIRYTMLDAIGEYVRQRLSKRREAPRLHSTHASYYTSLAETAEPLLKGTDQALWLARLDDEHHNLRAALDWLLSESKGERALRLSGALHGFWFAHGYLTEGRRWLSAALEQPQEALPATRAKALHGAGVLAWRQGEYDQAVGLLQQSLILRRELGDTSGIAAVIFNLGEVASDQADFAATTSYYLESLALRRELDDHWGIAYILHNLGTVAVRQLDFPRAQPFYEEALALRRKIGDQWGIATTLFNLGIVALERGTYDQARALFDEGLILYQKLGNQWGMAFSFFGSAGLAAAQGHGVRAARLIGAAEGLLASIGIPISPGIRKVSDRYVAATQALLDELSFMTGLEDGRSMPLEQAVVFALQDATQLQSVPG